MTINQKTKNLLETINSVLINEAHGVVLKNKEYGFHGSLNADKPEEKTNALNKIVPHVKRALTAAVKHHAEKSKIHADAGIKLGTASIAAGQHKVDSTLIGHFLDSTHGRHIAAHVNDGKEPEGFKTDLESRAKNFLTGYNKQHFTEEELADASNQLAIAEALADDGQDCILEYEKFTDKNGVTWNDEGESDAGHRNFGQGNRGRFRMSKKAATPTSKKPTIPYIPDHEKRGLDEDTIINEETFVGEEYDSEGDANKALERISKRSPNAKHSVIKGKKSGKFHVVRHTSGGMSMVNEAEEIGIEEILREGKVLDTHTGKTNHGDEKFELHDQGSYHTIIKTHQAGKPLEQKSVLHVGTPTYVRQKWNKLQKEGPKHYVGPAPVKEGANLDEEILREGKFKSKVEDTCQTKTSLGDDHWELHDNGTFHAIIKTHQHGKKLENHSVLHVGSPSYVRKKWSALRKQAPTQVAGTPPLKEGADNQLAIADCILEYEKYTDKNGVTWNDEGESDAGHRNFGHGKKAATPSAHAHNKKADEYKKFADASKKDSKEYHMNMALHHENKASYHYLSGRHNLSDLHNDKANHHEDMAMNAKKLSESGGPGDDDEAESPGPHHYKAKAEQSRLKANKSRPMSTEYHNHMANHYDHMCTYHSMVGQERLADSAAAKAQEHTRKQHGLDENAILEAEHITELSQKTLEKYWSKAIKSHRQAFKDGDGKTLKKRADGLTRAYSAVTQGGVSESFYDFDEPCDELTEGAHVIGVSVSDPSHPMVHKRNDKVFKHYKTSRFGPDEKDKAIAAAREHYKAKGLKVHDAEHFQHIDEGMFLAFSEEYDSEGDAEKAKERISKKFPNAKHSVIKGRKSGKFHVVRHTSGGMSTVNEGLGSFVKGLVKKKPAPAASNDEHPYPNHKISHKPEHYDGHKVAGDFVKHAHEADHVHGDSEAGEGVPLFKQAQISHKKAQEAAPGSVEHHNYMASHHAHMAKGIHCLGSGNPDADRHEDAAAEHRAKARALASKKTVSESVSIPQTLKDYETAHAHYHMNGPLRAKAELEKDIKKKYGMEALKQICRKTDIHQAKAEFGDQNVHEASDQAKANKRHKNLLDTVRGSRFKLDNPAIAKELDDGTGRRNPRDLNKAIGRALRNEGDVDPSRGSGHQLIDEEFSSSRESHLEVEFDKNGVHTVRHFKNALAESGDDVLADHEFHKVLSKFKPSKLDHETIQNELHHHLAKHGLYSHSERHPLVRSPDENKHLVDWSRVTAHKEAKHVGWHSDTTGNPETTKGNHHVAVWSTTHPTHIRDAELGKHGHTESGVAKQRPGGTSKANDGGKIEHEDGHVVVFNDVRAQHRASDNKDSHDRWFARIHNVRKIPKTGLPIPSPKGGETNHGTDVAAYAAAKKPTRDRPKESVTNWLARNEKHKNYGKALEHAKKYGLYDEKSLADKKKKIAAEQQSAAASAK